MVYFNYFIKCIIRKIVNLLFKPKFLFVFLLFLVLFGFAHSVFGADTSVNPTESDGNQVWQHDNLYQTLQNLQISWQDALINKLYALYSSNHAQAQAIASKIYNDLMYSKNSQRCILVYSIPEGWQVSTYAYADVKSTSEVNYIFGNMVFNLVPSVKATISYYDFINDDQLTGQKVGTQNMPRAFAYTMSTRWIDLWRDIGIITVATDEQELYILQRIYEVTANQKDYNQKFDNIQNSINQQGQNINNSLNNLNTTITDDNVNTDGLQFATDNTTNPTSDGFNTFFNTVYNAFCKTSSEPLSFTLPYINKSVTLNPDIVSDGMKQSGLGVVISLISSFYYFSVCLFIYKDITKIIDNLKSGNITSDCGNVKTEVL